LLHGLPLYDPNVDVAGPFAIYLYPPPFAVAFIPFAMLPSQLGLWIWILAGVAMTVAAIAILPVAAPVRWAILLLAGLDWPVAYAIKLGQVGPLLLLVFAVGWWLLRSQPAVGAIGAIGALIKVQPGLVLAWAALTGRWRAVGVGTAILLIAVAVTLPVVGVSAWSDYVSLLGKVSAPVTTPHNMTLGAVAFQAGLSESAAGLLQVAGLVATLVIWLIATRRRSAAVGYLATVVASQLLSPLLWDHYAMLLLIPVAWLIARRRWWAIVIPLATSWPLLAITPAATYPVVFLVCLAALVVVGRSDPDAGPAAA
jgi:alpha-1,2-mannosyltransferase